MKLARITDSAGNLAEGGVWLEPLPIANAFGPRVDRCQWIPPDLIIALGQAAKQAAA
jgi:mitochondrial fission protein ELM1